MSERGRKQTGLANLERSVTQIDQVSGMQAALRQAAYDSISESDVAEIMKKQVDKAKAGDERSAQFVMKFAVGLGNATSIKQTNVFCTDVATAARIARGGR